LPLGNPRYSTYGCALENNVGGLKHIFAASADRKDIVAAGNKSRPTHIGLPSTDSSLTWLFVFLASIIEKSPASFSESSGQITWPNEVEIMKLTTVESSMIHAIGYDSKKRMLEVVFNSGRTYCYEGVPPKIYKELMAAESKGRYMRNEIIDVYPYAQFSRSRRR
jgi:KTSC domain